MTHSTPSKRISAGYILSIVAGLAIGCMLYMGMASRKYGTYFIIAGPTILVVRLFTGAYQKAKRRTCTIRRRHR